VNVLVIERDDDIDIHGQPDVTMGITNGLIIEQTLRATDAFARQARVTASPPATR
jgi:hypothetical protein